MPQNVMKPLYSFLYQADTGLLSAGSSFKPLSALICLQEGIITPQTTYFVPAYYMAGNHRVMLRFTHGVVRPA